jgi:hypothetical protein
MTLNCTNILLVPATQPNSTRLVCRETIKNIPLFCLIEFFSLWVTVGGWGAARVWPTWCVCVCVCVFAGCTCTCTYRCMYRCLTHTCTSYAISAQYALIFNSEMMQLSCPVPLLITASNFIPQCWKRLHLSPLLRLCRFVLVTDLCYIIRYGSTPYVAIIMWYKSTSDLYPW